MSRNRFLVYILLVYIYFPITTVQAETEKNNIELLSKARDLFYMSLEDESKVDSAISLYEELGHTYSLKGKSLTYIGALYAIKGKHAFSPFTKLKWVNKGLEIMDQGLHESPEDIEALFIHGSTCFYLPFFFNRKRDAKENFSTIINLLPTKYDNYSSELILNMIEFFEINLNLEEKELNLLSQIKKEIVSN